MPPKKRSTRAAQLQPQPAISDYETDTATFTDNVAAHIAPPPTRTNTELNLLVLRRYCPEVERIVQIAPFAVVYSFSPETEGWEKIGTEGTLFVCQLAGASHSRYSVIILNRKSLDNFIVELESANNVEITDSYVILQTPAEDGTLQIYGLWIFSEENVTPSTQQVVAMAIEECAMRAEEGRKHAEEAYGEAQQVPQQYGLDGFEHQAQPPMEAPQQPQQSQTIDLMHLFGRPAQQQGPAQTVPEPAPQYPQQPKFMSNPDTDFFRSSNSPVAPPQFQQPPPQPASQQNVLLDMLHSARRG
ncbi:hypothetical protein WHR41_00683 [Cladosporium halotolerans]|uniref:PH domain-like protein n=1 Tax=Cladosporium halotolerans TaxID=1052096 RepID=A0AB34L5T8_9PEZI